MRFYEFRFSPIEDESMIDLLTGMLLQLGFESFSEEPGSLVAYLPESRYQEDLFQKEIFFENNPDIAITQLLLEDKNWNEEWERNYQPVFIAGKCYVRAPFHQPRPGTAFDILIEPKMAFGTAHHETTQLVATWLMELDVKGKQVLDMGCGTGILAILANKMGAGFVIGIDNDEWAWQNARDNFRQNHIENGEIIPGDASQIEAGKFDIILANINRNILMQDMASYANGLKKDGKILLSGFYESDQEAIKTKARKAGLDFLGLRKLDQWAVMLFIKEKG